VPRQSRDVPTETQHSFPIANDRAPEMDDSHERISIITTFEWAQKCPNSSELEKARTPSAKTNAGNVFVTRDLLTPK